MTARWMLCLDASAPRTCVAVGNLDTGALAVADEREDGANQTSERLHLRLAEALATAGLRPADLAMLACGRGPGTFTGSRVAVATAKGLALGLGLSIAPVSTLAALAASDPRGRPGGRVLALLDARRKQVYGGLFELGAEGLPSPLPPGEERVIELEGLVSALGPALDDERVLAFGPGCGPYAEQLPAALRARSQLAPGPDARGLWRAALAAARGGQAVSPEALDVAYLRVSYAEMGVNKPKRPVFVSPFV
ncbi:tRNA (adenosine(37)-N6)-threonylcarbamoyltransferase complex dimerization subunit type 1 TsaB [Pseudenhygromyxa sp. WMMC2535]|uniref:tRNA (adenosine(37)-N6)-threonylcarbamoyltransferase complex dimerization subunit type 1 TsaB n=1 Tax=Pseudenhygromyxa sp. WMMC2535 TaxID=2712867 RepID=UPI001553FB5F|nr:tRNA (adenosine(37)-N6)-threonylcarbamoyltransferase complex dimerization subunit type 1 TsaB [Pseudenhygromyxa sp. WMMC2535]NVB42560.1 tRNA (adenosine(37)-N6)-threonylcarbamoyltransferase complex dimerization subunit type 1 TsaB [Pseudenhygromyxa sp. WMMC2535]